MDTASTVSLHREALLRVLATLFVAAGMVPGGALVSRLPKPVRSMIERVLQPAESATRRLLLYLSRRTVLPPSRAGSASRSGGTRKGSRGAAFALFDRRKPFSELSQPGQRVGRGRGPGIWSFDGDGPAAVPEKPARDPDDALRLCRRMQALNRALLNMPREARRLLRAMARRAKAPPGPGRYGPLRPGLPPGYRRNPSREIDEILRDCHVLAWYDPPPDGRAPGV